jgi:hypothetical protein
MGEFCASRNPPRAHQWRCWSDNWAVIADPVNPCQRPVNQRHHKMLCLATGSSAHSTEKPSIASAISPWEVMTKVKSEFADPANPWGHQMHPVDPPFSHRVQSGKFPIQFCPRPSH